MVFVNRLYLHYVITAHIKMYIIIDGDAKYVTGVMMNKYSINVVWWPCNYVIYCICILSVHTNNTFDNGGICQQTVPPLHYQCFIVCSVCNHIHVYTNYMYIILNNIIIDNIYYIVLLLSL